MDKKKVFCYGDSNTYGHDPLTGKRLYRMNRWTGILQSMLGDDVEVVEQGCNGRTTVYPEPGADWKSGQYALKVCLYTYKPVEYIILMLGTNDLKTFYNATAEDIALGAEQLVKEAREFLVSLNCTEPKILLVSPIEIRSGISRTVFGDEFDETAVTRSRQFAELYRKVAERQNCYYLNAAEYASPSEEDCLHMMPDEHRKLAKAIYDTLQREKFFND